VQAAIVRRSLLAKTSARSAKPCYQKCYAVTFHAQAQAAGEAEEGKKRMKDSSGASEVPRGFVADMSTDPLAPTGEVSR